MYWWYWVHNPQRGTNMSVMRACEEHKQHMTLMIQSKTESRGTRCHFHQEIWLLWIPLWPLTSLSDSHAGQDHICFTLVSAGLRSMINTNTDERWWGFWSFKSLTGAVLQKLDENMFPFFLFACSCFCVQSWHTIIYCLPLAFILEHL